jgi:hypothetical protein
MLNVYKNALKEVINIYSYLKGKKKWCLGE